MAMVIWKDWQIEFEESILLPKEPSNIDLGLTGHYKSIYVMNGIKPDRENFIYVFNDSIQ